MALSQTATVLIERYKPRVTLDLGQVAEVLGMHPQSLRNKLSKSGAESFPFKVRKIGQGNWQVSIASLGAYLDGEVEVTLTPQKTSRGRRRMQERFAEFLTDLNMEFKRRRALEEESELELNIPRINKPGPGIDFGGL